MLLRERKQQRGGGGGGGGRGERQRERETAGPVALCSAAGTSVHSFILGSFGFFFFFIRGDKGRAQQVINALSVSLPMFCRSGASQEESKAGGEYSFVCVHVFSTE